jgi:hypothetical protein
VGGPITWSARSSQRQNTTGQLRESGRSGFPIVERAKAWREAQKARVREERRVRRVPTERADGVNVAEPASGALSTLGYYNCAPTATILADS